MDIENQISLLSKDKQNSLVRVELGTFTSVSLNNYIYKDFSKKILNLSLLRDS